MFKTQELPASSNQNWRQMLEDEYQGRQTYAFSKGFNVPLHIHDIWIVCRGVVQICTLDSEGQESILGLACPDMPFGPPLTQIKAYEAIALTDVVLMRIEQSELERSPLLAQRILIQLNRRFQQTEALLSIVHHRLIRKRIEQLLLLLAREVGEMTPEGVRICVRFTHQQIANLTGTSRVTASRILSSLRKEGWMSVDQTSHFVIHDSAVSES
ncbi:Crp/Fnr family transcriptional regulator [Acaryochloris marina]|uniref:Transcriptional regulator, Crp/Fnr family n=1 Tax=Acaryochloris marina (strain MBIC 11017) TaxID=329726 RepID=A8ZKX0_ACAM1|nr:Crp/Fnr family transcriptional regulator [Acaryochloris marina]ABW31438.1 transcriptional regulator, Crp/Fnr family [Acaryochloris marina MBIC11017]